MGVGSGLALKTLQWIIRGIQLLCAAVVLGIFSYFLATLHNHDIYIERSVRAVEGISGAAVLYTLIGLLLLCCVAGLAFTSLIAIVLDLCFIGAFIYVAVVNRNGAGSCRGYLDTPFGRGQSTDEATGSKGGFTNLPSFHTACRLQTASMALSIIAIFFFLLSIVMEVVLVRHHRKEKRFGPGPRNDYTSGSGSRGGFLGRFRRNKMVSEKHDDSSGLPEHTHPEQLNHNNNGVARQSYGTDATNTTAATHDARGASADYRLQDTGYAYQPPLATAHPQGGWHTAAQTNPPPENYRYGDGVYQRA